MSVSDLTGCVWIANNNISASNSYTTYNINFSNNNISGSNVKIPLANYSYGKVFSSGVNSNTFNDLCLNSSNQWIIYNNDEEYVVETIGTLEITITGGTDATNSTLIAWLEANGTLTAPQPTANTYTITHTLTNVAKGNITLQLTPDTGYELPDTISVSNGTLVSYDKTTGIAVVSGDDNTSVSVECVAVPSAYNVTLVLAATNGGSITVTIDGTTYLSSWSGSLTTFNVTAQNTIVIDKVGGSGSFNTNTSYSATGGVSITNTSDYEITATVTGDGTLTLDHMACFVAGTQITLADYTTKNVENITYEDELLVYDFYEGKLNTAKPSWIMQEFIGFNYKKITLSDGTILKLVGKDDNCHRLFNVTKQKMLYANECVGDEVYKQDGTIVKVLSCETVQEEIKFYNLTTEKYYNCFANGVLTGSRLNNMYNIENMKYTDNVRLISEEEEQKRWKVREKLRK